MFEYLKQLKARVSPEEQAFLDKVYAENEHWFSAMSLGRAFDECSAIRRWREENCIQDFYVRQVSQKLERRLQEPAVDGEKIVEELAADIGNRRVAEAWFKAVSFSHAVNMLTIAKALDSLMLVEPGDPKVDDWEEKLKTNLKAFGYGPFEAQNRLEKFNASYDKCAEAYLGGRSR